MPGPMPPPPPQGAPPQAGGPGGPPPQQNGAGAISSLLKNVDQAIDHLTTVITQSKATSPEEKQMISAVDQIYGKLMDSLGQGGDQDADDSSGGGPGQTVPAEAGGNKGAIPSPM